MACLKSQVRIPLKVILQINSGDSHFKLSHFRVILIKKTTAGIRFKWSVWFFQMADQLFFHFNTGHSGPVFEWLLKNKPKIDKQAKNCTTVSWIWMVKSHVISDHSKSKNQNVRNSNCYCTVGIWILDMSVVKRVESCPNVELSGIQMESEYLTLLSIIQVVPKHSIDTLI